MALTTTASKCSCGDPTAPLISTPTRRISQASLISNLDKCAPEESDPKWGVCHVGSAELSTAVPNLVLAVLGAGQLTLPYALSKLGLGFGLLCLISFTGLSIFSCRMLSVHAIHYQRTAEHCLDSFTELVVRVGRECSEGLARAGESICTFIVAVYAWGGGVTFLIILKAELEFLTSLAGLDAGVAPLLIVSLFFVWPLSCLYDMSGLKALSPLACFAAVFVTFVVFLCTPWDACAGPLDAVSGAASFKFGEMRQTPGGLMEVAAALPLLAFALNSSWAYVPILCTLREKSDQRVWTLIGSSNGIIVSNYLFLSFCGYWTFCDATQPDILASLGHPKFGVDPDTWRGALVVLARSTTAFQLSIGLPVRFFVTRRALGFGEVPRFQRVCLAGVLVGSATLLAALPLSVDTALGIVSSICASMIIYILPAAMDFGLGWPGKRRRPVCSAISLLVGLFVMIFGLWAIFAGVSVGS